MGGHNASGRGDGGFDRRMEEMIGSIESELRQAITYVNDRVVPRVRKESITAMRTAAETLRDLADRFERTGGAPAGPTGGDQDGSQGRDRAGKSSH